MMGFVAFLSRADYPCAVLCMNFGTSLEHGMNIQPMVNKKEML